MIEVHYLSPAAIPAWTGALARVFSSNYKLMFYTLSHRPISTALKQRCINDKLQVAVGAVTAP